MAYQSEWSVTIPNDETDSPKRIRLFKAFRPHRRHRSHSSITASSLLYLACQNNDLAHVELYLKEMKLKEIDYQYPPNNETVLHIATRNQHQEIIKTLLRYGAQRSRRNKNGQLARELAETQEITDLFIRPESGRFTFLQNSDKATALAQRKIKCKSCSLVNDASYYEWELVDGNATHKALKFRRELSSTKPMNDKGLRQKLYSTIKGYLNARLQEIYPENAKRIRHYFKCALQEQDPSFIITAYTTSQEFTKLLNTDMARNVIHDLKNGCSKFCCECLYSTEDGTKSITSILLHHPKFEPFRYKGHVYRGIAVPENALDHYKVDSCIITTTFVSTSKNRDTARMFCDKSEPNSAKRSYICIYEILSNERTALDISGISEFVDEDEVLILPYSSFLITSIEEREETTIIHLKEQCLSQMLDIQGLQKHSMRSTACLLELVGSSLLQNAGGRSIEETDSR